MNFLNHFPDKFVVDEIIHHIIFSYYDNISNKKSFQMNLLLKKVMKKEEETFKKRYPVEYSYLQRYLNSYYQIIAYKYH